jgi:hypothetical protein
MTQKTLNKKQVSSLLQAMTQSKVLDFLSDIGISMSAGAKAWGTFMSLVATTRKLGISFLQYVRDRITRTGKIEPLAQIIYNNQVNIGRARRI